MAHHGRGLGIIRHGWGGSSEIKTRRPFMFIYLSIDLFFSHYVHFYGLCFCGNFLFPEFPCT